MSNGEKTSDHYLLPVPVGHRDESICPMTISCPRETRVELDLREADAQEQLVQLLARIEPMSQAECAHVPSSDVEPFVVDVSPVLDLPRR